MKRILLIDDHEVVRAGVKRIFEKQPIGDVRFGEASTGRQALDLVQNQDWDIAVLDLSLGGRDGLEVLKELKHSRPRLPVLILSMHAEELFARRAFKAGANGYITKNTPRTELLAALNKVIAGGTYISPRLAEELAVDLRKGENRLPHELLSDREFEVMRLIASGKTVGEIAQVLSLSVGTISTYRMRILEKMEMKTNAELTRYAIVKGLAD
jgi:DNA-binding NarL/FixJ family response regulator